MGMRAVTVINLSTLETRVYTSSPRKAVIAAYAQEQKDWNTWDYEKRYAQLVQESDNLVSCGDWTVLKEG